MTIDDVGGVELCMFVSFDAILVCGDVHLLVIVDWYDNDDDEYVYEQDDGYQASFGDISIKLTGTCCRCVLCVLCVLMMLMLCDMRLSD